MLEKEESMSSKGGSASDGAFDTILNQQQSWARQNNVEIDQDGYTLKIEDNLFSPLSADSMAEFADGAGDEFGQDGTRGKMQALHSSSALVCNVFEYWRGHDVDAIAQACGAPAGMSKIHFEHTHRTPLKGKPPHLDVEFQGHGLKPLAIESKFTEPYQHTTVSGFARSYLETPGLWDALPRCGEFARDIAGKRIVFSRLDAPQLIKHILGLTTAYGPSGFELLYLWYDCPSPEAMDHQLEIGELQSRVGDEVSFRTMKYQELFEVVKNLDSAGEDYISYLRLRYFSDQ